jgi:hypothetical protein
MIDKSTNQNGAGATTPDKDQPVSFAYPEGFKAAVNSLDFLPEEVREETLSGLVMTIVSS